ncbi:MAG: zf-HC2 domain-containing protein [Caldilineales bacterium]|nr:zf-HC2 domain-containing protein [Caldilineales bacterium]
MSSLPNPISDDLLSAYIDGQLTADERVRIEQALTADASAQQRMTTLKYTVDLFKQAPSLTLPHAFVLSEQDVLVSGGRVRGVKGPSFWQRLLGPLNKIMPLATAAVAVVLLLTFALPYLSGQQSAPAAESATFDIAAAPLAPAAETMIVESEQPVAESAMEEEASAVAMAMESGEVITEAPSAERIIEDSAAAEQIEEPRLFSQAGGAATAEEEEPVAAKQMEEPSDAAAEVALVASEPAQADQAAAMPPAQETPATTTRVQPLQIGLVVLFAGMLAATVWLRKRVSV